MRSRLPYLVLAIFVLALVARLLPGLRTIDDAYITFRYARNLLAGDGFVFNAGERVLGTTTPLFTLLLAMLGAFTGGVNANFPQIAAIISAIADGITAVLLLKLGTRLSSRWAGIAATLVWCISPYSVTFAIGGLETSVYVLLLIALFYSYLQRRYTLAAGLAAAALLTRPDALLFLAPLTLDRVFLASRRGDPKPNLNEVFAFFAPLLSWGVFAWLYFGSPIPQSLLAKSIAYRLEPLSGLVRFLQHYATPFLEHLTFGTLAIRIGIVLYPALSMIGALAIYKREKSIWPFALFPWIYLVAFSVANPLVFRWYLTPPLPFYFLFILLGLEALLTELASKLRRRSSAVFVFICALLLASTLRGWTLHPTQPPDRPAPEMAWIELEQLYIRAAQDLAAQLATAPDAVIAAGDVGALGYFTNAHILDLVGLNSRETLAYYPMGSASYGDFIYAVSPDLIADQQPDFVIILEIYGRYALLPDPRFLNEYGLINTIPTDIYGRNGSLLTFARQ